MLIAVYKAGTAYIILYVTHAPGISLVHVQVGS